MAQCPQCKSRVWTLKRTNPKLCPTCEETTGQEVRQRLADVKEQWGLFRRATDESQALDHVENALRHARILNSYHRIGYRNFVPSPPPVLDLLERTKRRISAMAKWTKSEDAEGPDLMAGHWEENAVPEGIETATAPSVIHVGPPEGWDSSAPAPYSASDCGTHDHEAFRDFVCDSTGKDCNSAYAETEVWLDEAYEVADADLFEFCQVAQREDRRVRQRMEPLGLSAQILERDEEAAVMDLSKSGISVETRFPEPEGTKLSLVFGKDGKRLEALGVVRWTTPSRAAAGEGTARMGLKFLQLRRSGSSTVQAAS